MKVQIKNYQAIKEANLEFKEGITAIIGPTNSGKSSILRAIKGAINNQSGNGFINYEAEESKVKLIEGNNEVEWIKGKKGSGKYIINGEEITKIGRTQNQEVAELFNMEEIEVGNNKVRINFWDQMEKAFLMDNTPGQLFNFIAQSKEQEQVVELETIKKTELQALSNEIKTQNTRVDILQADVAKLTDINNKLKPFYDFDIESLDQRIQISQTVSNLSKSYDALRVELNNLKTKAKNLETPIKTLGDILEVTKILQDRFKAVHLKNNEKNTLTLEAQELTSKALENNKQLIILENLTKALEANHKDLEQTRGALNNLKTVYNKYLSQSKEITELISARDALKIKELEQELEEFKVCPFCGSALNGEESCENE